jgi:hypothetical protein
LTIHTDAACPNGTATLLAIFKTDFCDDSRYCPLYNDITPLAPQLLNQCLNSGLGSIAFYCNKTYGAINLSDARAPQTAVPYCTGISERVQERVECS